ncbi:MAG: hypothetical protein GY797_00340 [Deltaproteobacteria bacterium]|nr:hypothetical protein [Deltaproteobacteria bacterium]
MPSDHQTQNLRGLVTDLASSWPVKGKRSKFMPKRDIEMLIKCSSKELEDFERQNPAGNFPYMYTKLKMHADHYGLHYSIPAVYEEACKQKEREMGGKKWKFW